MLHHIDYILKKPRLNSVGDSLYSLLCLPNDLLADGSKDLYPPGADGHRAALRISTTTSSSYPFASRGVHYVYAKVGETITLAFSGQVDASDQHIWLYGVSGEYCLFL